MGVILLSSMSTGNHHQRKIEPKIPVQYLRHAGDMSMLVACMPVNDRLIVVATNLTV
jgi:hypothetical protein